MVELFQQSSLEQFQFIFINFNTCLKVGSFCVASTNSFKNKDLEFSIGSASVIKEIMAASSSIFDIHFLELSGASVTVCLPLNLNFPFCM